jgi:outer membrane protein assembly factor BamD (BamD/ComL family)
MSDSARFGWVVRAGQVSWVAAVISLALSIPLTIVASVEIFLNHYAHWGVLLAGGVLVVGELAAIACVTTWFGAVSALVATHGAAAAAASRLERLETLMETQVNLSRKLIDISSLSDQARTLLFRDREIETMRETIHANLMAQDYASAESLIASLEKRPAYADEAVRLRKEVEDFRRATIEDKLKTAVARVEAIIEAKDFARALREAQRVAQAFPNSEKATSLPARIELARNNHKRDLLQAYGEAVGRNDVDRGIDLLRELDKYLTPQEAAALEDSARGVFRAKLHNLGVQFAIKVTEQNWSEAIAVGEQIMRDFPNSRMATEVGAKMEQLRNRASSPAPPKA